MSAFDARGFKQRDRKAWGLASVGYAREFLDLFAPVGARMLAMARPVSGARILDVACGPGEPALSAARYLRNHAWILAADVAKGMVSLASQRARQLRFDCMRFAVMDGEELACRNGVFDLAMCRFGVMLVPDAEKMLAEMRRVVRDGGKIALAVWGERERAPLLSVGRDVVASYFPQINEPGVPSPHAFGTPDVLRMALKATGLRNIETDTMTLEIGFPSTGALWGALAEGTSLKLLLSESPPALVAEIRAAVEVAAQPYFHKARARVELPTEVILGLGRA